MGEVSGAVSEAVAGTATAADVVGDPTRCARCEGGLGEAHFRINGRNVCLACQRRLRGSPVFGLGLGLLAAGASVGLYYGVLRVLDMRFVLIAVVAGVVVGAAVRRGAGYGMAFLNRPMALALTYAVVVTTYVHSVLDLSDAHTLQSAWWAALTLPFRMALEGKNLVALALLALGLHEAWQFSKPPKVHEEGPFETRGAATGDRPAGAAEDTR